MTSQPKSLDARSQIPPNLDILPMITGNRVTQLIYVAAKLGIADLLKNGPKTCSELAQAAGAHARSLYRVMRALASVGIFSELEDGRFDMTPLAACLQTGVPDSRRFTAITFGQEYHVILGSLLHSVQTGEAAFNHIYGTGYFQYLAENPEAAAVFNAFMTETKMVDYRPVVFAYDYTGLSKIIDVGGGHGTVLSMILDAYPTAKGVLFDSPSVVEGAKAHIEAAGLAGRCEVMRGDFFESVPGGGDAYILSQITHDWPDEQAVVLLKNCHRAMAENGKLVVMDHVIRPGNAPSPGKMLDITMMVLLGSQERTEAEFRTLFAAAGFRLTKVIYTNGSADVIEAVRA